MGEPIEKKLSQSQSGYMLFPALFTVFLYFASRSSLYCDCFNTIAQCFNVKTFIVTTLVCFNDSQRINKLKKLLFTSCFDSLSIYEILQRRTGAQKRRL